MKQGRPPKENKSVYKAVYFEPETAKIIERIAKKNKRSFSAQVQVMCEEWLSKQDKS